MKGKLDALNKLGSYIDGMEPKKEESSEKPNELEKGVKCEMEEHGMSEEEATRVAMDHLEEDPMYYSKEEESEEDPNEAREVEEMGSKMEDGEGMEDGEEEPKISISVLARNKPKGFNKKRF